MAGHSKWANIKHRKAQQDAVKGRVYTRLIREITVAAKMGDPDPSSNPRLRTAVDKAFAANMSRDVVDRAIKRGAGGVDGAVLEEVRYEGYGPGGVAVIVECMTDNRNRTVADVRHAFTKMGGNLGTDGSVSWMFNKLGQMTFEPGANEERVMEIALENGAEDITVNDDKSIEVLTAPENFQMCLDAMSKANLKPAESEISLIAKTGAPIDDKDTADKFLRLVDMLEELDDVQNVYSNAELPETD
ncbi:MAG: YebC/PmpR family DNA-binding transcriptional regulator [Gammaproteobacteria bacterium]|nr:YebC/PmpR family DNA-binding transcriptional regulator [Gammaproteobacteria bacterium]